METRKKFKPSTVKDVPVDAFLVAFAAHLKKSGKVRAQAWRVQTSYRSMWDAYTALGALRRRGELERMWPRRERLGEAQLSGSEACRAHKGPREGAVHVLEYRD